MSEQIKRYEESSIGMREDKQGSYVLHSDHVAALKAEAERRCALLDAARALVSDGIGTYLGEDAVWRALDDAVSAFNKEGAK